MRQLKIEKRITNRSEESVDKYLSEISRIPMITSEEEVVLAQAIHSGGRKGEKAKEKLVTANLRFVLNERERLIVVQNFGIGCPERILDDIGYGMGLTRERVRQIRERILFECLGKERNNQRFDRIARRYRSSPERVSLKCIGNPPLS